MRLKFIYVFVSGSGYEKPAEVVINLIGNEKNFPQVKKMMPVIFDVISLCVSKVTEESKIKTDLLLCTCALTALKNMLNSSLISQKLHNGDVSYI